MPIGIKKMRFAENNFRTYWGFPQTLDIYILSSSKDDTDRYHGLCEKTYTQIVL